MPVPMAMAQPIRTDCSSSRAGQATRAFVLAEPQIARFSRSAGVESVSSSAADFGSSSGGGATASASAATAAASTASVRGSTARGALHCFWPRYGSSFSAVSSHKAAERRQERLPAAVAALSGWFTDGPLHMDCQDSGEQQPQGLAGLWRYQGFRL